MNFDVDTNAGLVAADLVATGVKAGARAFAVTRHHAMLVQALAKRNASKPRTGPPGPRLQTGTLVRSINTTMSLSPVGPTATIGSNVVYARRIEMGFNGVDSRGRRYRQPPYSFLSPALDAVAPAFAAAIAAIVTDE